MKFIVKVNIPNESFILTTVAKNSAELENKLAKEFQEMKLLEYIKCVEYERVKKCMFNKKEPYYFVGSVFVSGKCFKWRNKDE